METEDLDSTSQEYSSYLQSLDTKTKIIILDLLTYISDNRLTSGNYTYSTQALLIRAVRKFKQSYNGMLINGTITAIRYAKDLRKAELALYIAKVEKELSQKNLGIGEAATILHRLEYAQISPVFNGSKDVDIVNRVWYKNWADGLTLTERINRVGDNAGKLIEKAIKQGIIIGESPEAIEKNLRDHFVNGPEQRAMLRLATHTINMVHEATKAEIASNAPMVKGIRIMRSAAGSEKCQICEEHAGEVGGPGIEYLKENGESLDALADMPPYHAYCMCDSEMIFEDVSKFVNESLKRG